jgi:hypothetical protein
MSWLAMGGEKEVGQAGHRGGEIEGERHRQRDRNREIEGERERERETGEEGGRENDGNLKARRAVDSNRTLLVNGLTKDWVDWLKVIIGPH